MQPSGPVFTENKVCGLGWHLLRWPDGLAEHQGRSVFGQDVFVLDVVVGEGLDVNPLEFLAQVQVLLDLGL